MKHNICFPWTAALRALAKMVFRGLALVCVLGWWAMSAGAATRTWNGMDGALWSDPDNWFPLGPPQNGDSLTFPDVDPFGEQSMVNDLPNLTVNTITFTAGAYSLNGNALTFVQGITDNHSGALNRVRCDIQFTSGGGRFNSLDVGQLEITGTTTLANNQDLIITAGISNITVSGAIIGNGSLVKRGEGALFLRGSVANTYTGRTTVAGGEMHLAKTSAARAISADVIIDGSAPGWPSLSDHLPGQYPPVLSMLITNGGTWLITNGATVTNLVMAENGSIEGSGLLNLQCDVTASRPDFPASYFFIECALFLGDQTRTFRVNGGSATLWVRGQIIGPGPGANSPGIIKRGSGDLILDAANIYFGPTLIQGGRLLVYNGGALGGAGAGAETTVKSGELEFAGAPSLTVAEPLVMDGGHIRFGGIITLTGPVVLNDSCFIMGLSASLLEFRGAISGPETFEVLGGTVRLSGPAPNTFGGGAAFSVLVQPDNSFLNTTLAALELAKPDNVVAVPVPVRVLGWDTNIAVLRNFQNGGVSDVLIAHSGSWQLNGHSVAPTALRFRGDGFVDTQGGQLQLTSPGTNQLHAIPGSGSFGPSNYTAQILGTVACLGATNEITVDAGVTLDIRAQISGSGTIRKAGGGTALLFGNNFFTGPLFVEAGILHSKTATSLGSTGAGTTVRDGGTLRVESAPALAEPLNIRGRGHGGTEGALFLFPATGVQAGIVLAADATVRNDTSFAILSGIISGPGGLTKTGAGTLQLGGGSGAANTYTGDTFVEEGILVPFKGTGVTTIPGHLIIGGGGGLFGASATVRHFAGFTIVGSVTVDRGGLWDLNGFSEGFGIADLQGRPALTLKVGGDVQTGAGTLFLPVGGDVVVTPGTFPGASSFISGNLGLDPGPHRFSVQSGVPIFGLPRPELDVSAAVSQTSTAAEIVKEGFGEMRLGAANSFTGPVTVNEGGLTAAHALALGITAAGTFVNSNATLALDGGFDVTDETLTLDSTNAAALLSLGPVTNGWSGNIILQRTAGIRVTDARGGLRHSGIPGFGTPSPNISGPGGFTKSGPGALFVEGLSRGNSYTGSTTINDGLVEAVRGGRSLSSNIVVTGPNSTLRTGRAAGLFAAGTVLPSGASVAVQNGALWSMNGTNFETLSRLQGDGRLTVSTGGALTVSNSVSCEFSGPISGSGALNKYGLATFHVTGTSPGYTGLATVFDGTYKVDGNYLNGPVLVKLSSILRGTGVVGDVTVENGGVVRVDSDGEGRLGGEFVMNSANFQNGGVLALAFYGPHPTGGNDHLYVNNAVTLTSPSLSSGFNYPPHEGDVITLIDKSAAGAVSGAIGGFPEGAVRLIGSIPVVTSYVGGNGNDVTLTVTNLPLRSGGTQLVSSRGGSVLVPNDCSQLWLGVTNRGATALTGLRGTLRSLTPGVVVTRAESAYPDLATNARGTNAQPFQIRTEASYPCGGRVQFELILTAANFPPTAIVYTMPGTLGSALSFDGRDDFVQVATNAFAAVSNNFTIELWANPAGSRTETPETNFGVSGVSVALRQLQRFAVFPDRGDLSYGANHVGAGLSIGNNGITAYEYAANFLPSRLVYSNAVSGWTHVALVYASRRPRLYVNGVLVRSGTTAAATFVHASANLGGSIHGNFGDYRGQLDEVRIWNVALSEAEIQTSMSRSLTGTEPGLVAYFRCDEGEGITLADSAPASPNRNGTLTDNTSFVFPGAVPMNLPADCNSGGGACESCHVVRGQFTTNAPESARRIAATARPSSCDPPASCPGVQEFPDAPVRHVLHSYTNSTASELCVTAQLRMECSELPAGSFGVAAYLGEFLVNQPCSNYLGDDGAAEPTPPPFSFRVPPRTNFLLVVTERVSNPLCDRYTLELFGLPCPPPRLDIAHDATPGKVRLSWSSAYPEFGLQSVNSLNGPGPHGFGNIATPPVLVGGKFAVTNAATAPRQFFRLAK